MTICQHVSDRDDQRPRFDDADDSLTHAPTDMAMRMAIDVRRKRRRVRRLREAEPTPDSCAGKTLVRRRDPVA
jgi:hypothetical protein